MSSFYELPADKTAVTIEGKKIHVGIGWDPMKGTLLDNVKGAAEELFNGVSGKAYDLNIAAVVRHEGGTEELVFFGKKYDKSESVHYLHDDRTGTKKGEDEAIDINLEKLPAAVKEIVLFTVIYNGHKDKKNFKMIENFFAQVKDVHIDKVIYRDDSDMYQEEPSKHSVYVFASIKRDADKWVLIPQHRFSDEDTEQELQANLKSE
jgi:stress response protein SCP2